MEVDIHISYKGEFIADLGRAYHYDEGDPELKEDYIYKLMLYGAYTPKDLGEIREIEDDIKEIIYKLGGCFRREVIDEIIRDGSNLRLVRE